jgi:hypothetical protein|nr:MAG TPA: Protein of unknown function (DUF1351) [Caudoviricetes sp.]
MNEIAKIENLVPVIGYDQDGIKIANLEELTGAVNAQAERFRGLIVTGDTYKDAKSARAELNKYIKELNDARIKAENSYMEPFNLLKSQIKDLMAILEVPKNDIDAGIKEVEEAEKEAKRAHVAQLVEEHGQGYPIEWKASWLNKTAKDANIIDDIKDLVRQAQEAEKALEADIKSVEQGARMIGAESAPWVELVKTGMPVNEVLDRMAEHKEKQEQEEQEQPTAEPTPEPEQQAESQDLMTFTLKLTGTHEQLMEVRRVIDDLGVYFEVV